MLEIELFNYLTSITAITDLVDERIYPLIAPQEDAFPRITYIRIYSDYLHSLNELEGQLLADVQLDIWAETYLEAKQLAEIVRDNLNLSEFSSIKLCVLMAEVDLLEQPTEGREKPIYHIAQEYHFFKEE